MLYLLTKIWSFSESQYKHAKRRLLRHPFKGVFLNILYAKMGFSRNNCTLLSRISIFFEVDPPGFPFKFTVTPLEFSIFFALTPWKSMFFLNFLRTPVEFQRLLLYPPGIFHWYPQQGGIPFVSLSVIPTKLASLPFSKIHKVYSSLLNLTIWYNT